jgi:DNA-binding MarR family transcriptional regulator
MSDPDRVDPAARAWALLRELTTSPEVVAREHAFMHGVGLTAGPVRALRALLELGPQPMSALAVHMGCDASYVTGLVKTLLAHDLVAAEPSPRDGRVKIIALTPAGVPVAEEAQRVHETPPAALGALPEAELTRLGAILAEAMGAEAMRA